MAESLSTPAITKGILKLARQLDATSAPDYVMVAPHAECVAGSNCFLNVAVVTKRHGGTVQHGWKMREQPSAYVEGEFYAVWRRDDGILIDVTPRQEAPDRIIFLPDSRMVWKGDDVEPRRMMLNLQPCYCGSGMPFKICHNLAED
jgi:hypothetical protein